MAAAHGAGDIENKNLGEQTYGRYSWKNRSYGLIKMIVVRNGQEANLSQYFEIELRYKTFRTLPPNVTSSLRNQMQHAV